MTKKLASRKGYTEYYWTGFLLQIVGLIYVAGLPVNDDKSVTLMADAIQAAMQGSYTTPLSNAAPSPADPANDPLREKSETTEQQPAWTAPPVIDHSDQVVAATRAETEGFVICPLCGTEQPEANKSCWKCRANFAR